MLFYEKLVARQYPEELSDAHAFGVRVPLDPLDNSLQALRIPGLVEHRMEDFLNAEDGVSRYRADFRSRQLG